MGVMMSETCWANGLLINHNLFHLAGLTRHFKSCNELVSDAIYLRIANIFRYPVRNRFVTLWDVQRSLTNMRTQLRETDKTCLFSYLSSLRKTCTYFKNMEVRVNKFFRIQKYIIILGYVNGHFYWKRYMIWYDKIWYMIRYDYIWYAIFNCNFVATRWQ